MFQDELGCRYNFLSKVISYRLIFSEFLKVKEYIGKDD